MATKVLNEVQIDFKWLFEGVEIQVVLRFDQFDMTDVITHHQSKRVNHSNEGNDS